jgi:hypothetical protein
MFSIVFALALVLSFSLMITTPVAAAERHVGSGQTYGTIQAAITAANPGDTIIVHAGTYNEVVSIAKSLTLKGQPGAKICPDNSTALLDGGVRRVAIYINAVDNVTVEGFEIAGTCGTVHCGVYGFNSNNLTVRNNVVHDIANSIASPVSDVAGNGIMAFGWDQGISGALFQGNTVYNTGRMGIVITAMRGSDYKWFLCANNTIKNNTVYNAWQGPTNDGGGAIQINGAKNTLISGNTAHDTVIPTSAFSAGVYIYGSAGGSNLLEQSNVYSNKYGVVIWNNPSDIIWGSDAVGAPKVNYNNIYGNTHATAGGLWAIDSPAVNATYNWWGANDGPGGQGPGGGNAVSAHVLFVPWACQPTTGGLAYLTPSAGVIDDLTPVSTPANPPATFPYGMFTFKITGISTGGEVTLTIELPGPMPVGTKWWKYHNNTWSPMDIGSDDGDNVITVTLKDGRTPDDEDLVNGQITDQGGPASPTVGWETYPINKVRVFLPWIALLAAFILAASLLALRRRRAQT